MAIHEVTCQAFVELVTDYFEGALTDPTLSHVEEHLVMCDWCVTYANQMGATVAALRTLPPDPVPGQLQNVVAAALARDRRAKNEPS